MKLIGPPAAFAPMPTGHPLGLPGQMSVKDAQTRVVEPAKSGSTNLATHLGLPMRKPASVQEDATDTAAQKPPRTDAAPAAATQAERLPPDPAPPTILQIKINEILQAQAESMAEEAALARLGAAAQTPPVETPDSRGARLAPAEPAPTAPKEATFPTGEAAATGQTGQPPPAARTAPAPEASAPAPATEAAEDPAPSPLQPRRESALRPALSDTPDRG